uniref:ATP-binding protein n=1 Tax=Ndongobacter massiliensis TaxID=1871025 RepID=UPI000930B4E1|nr:AAA family ATPase [Ndongobacter massiliensis]
MKREIMDQLIQWKDKKNRKPLMITGVRQCGKTYIIKKFAKNEFEESLYFNFDGNTGLQSVFAYDLDIDRILHELEIIHFGKKITPGKTLLIFDEIQACPRAISSLKYFCENKADLHIIAAGSLLGVALKQEGVSFPVGKVERLAMFPMNFEEFVIADGGEKYIEGLRRIAFEREIPELYTVPMEKYLKNYYIVGGMPEVVQTWVDTHNYEEVEYVQDNILKDYPDDFSKHTTNTEANRIHLIWDSIPTQIARENNKFIFSHVKKSLRAKDLEDSLQWLVNSGLAYRLYCVNNPQVPLSGMVDATYFKVYMSDVGLLRRKSNLNYRTIWSGERHFSHFKGALTENYVMTQLIAMGMNCCFWRTKADAEVDFITDYEGLLIPIEVKSADNTKAKSLRIFCERYEPEMSFKLSLKNVGDNQVGKTQNWSIPLYCIFRLKDYIHYTKGWDRRDGKAVCKRS